MNYYKCILDFQDTPDRERVLKEFLKVLLELIRSDLQKHCMHLFVIELGNTFSVIADFTSKEPRVKRQTGYKLLYWE